MQPKWWVLASVACGTFMSTLDSSIVNIALPTLTNDLVTTITKIKWVVIGYLLAITSLILPFGRLSDHFGRRQVFATGFLIFSFGSMLCGLATDVTFLILSRILQGVGAAMLMANGPAIITSTFPPDERGKALGILAMVVSAGLITGPSVGGILISYIGWRSIFLLNVPIGLIGTILAYRFIRQESGGKVNAPFDWAGAVIQMVALILLIFALDPPEISMSGSAPVSLPSALLAILAFIFGALFVKIETEVKSPILDLSLLKYRTFWTANLAGFLMFVAFSSVTVLMPFFLEEALLFDTAYAGLIMTAIPLTILVVAPLSGRLSDRVGSRGLSATGAGLVALSLFLMSGLLGPGLTSGTSQLYVVVLLCLVGLGTGLFQSPNNNAIMGCVPKNKLGTASAMLATIRNLGMVMGTGMATGIFTWKRATTGDFVHSLHFAHLLAGVIGVTCLIASLGKKSGPFWKTPEELQAEEQAVRR